MSPLIQTGVKQNTTEDKLIEYILLKKKKLSFHQQIVLLHALQNKTMQI